MSGELYPSSGEFSFVSHGLAHATTLTRMVASSGSRSWAVSVSTGSAKVMSPGMASESPKAVCSVFAVRGRGIQIKTMDCLTGAQSSESHEMRRRRHTLSNDALKSTQRIHVLRWHLRSLDWAEKGSKEMEVIRRPTEQRPSLQT